MNGEEKKSSSTDSVDIESFKLELSKKLVGLINHPNASKETKDELSGAISDLLGVK